MYSIIPAGGAGTRLWPLSRKSKPKFLIDLTGQGRTLIQGTVDRLASLSEEIFVVTGEQHVSAVASQLREELAAENIIVEPSPRDSMAAIGLAAAVIERRHGDVVVGSFAADHLIKDVGAFAAAVREAERAAEAGYVVTIGIEPDRPATGFGYIELGERLEGSAAYQIRAFTEKPDAARAQRYLDSGRYRWNAGMFVARAKVLRAALERFEPELAAGIAQIAQDFDAPKRADTLARVWPTLKKIAIDHAIAEPLAAEGGMAVVPANMGWSDVGDYASLRDVLDSYEQVSPGGEPHAVVAINSPGTLAYTHSKPVVVVGMEDAVIVETADVILVTSRQKSQEVKNVPAKLDETDLRDLE